MSGKRQKIQYSLALEPKSWGETPVSGYPRAEPLAAKPAPESPAVTEQLMEEVCVRENLQSAWKRVRRNQGGPGVDGMTIDDARDFLCEVLKLIRAFLNAGVMEDGLVLPVDEGTPQGGPLSPLLSNLMLDDLDKELTRRGHRFRRHADDCNIYVRSHAPVKG